MPQELPSVLSLVYSNIPPIKKGTDSRFGFGFRLGEHADYQVLVELGPQKYTRPLGNFTFFFFLLTNRFKLQPTQNFIVIMQFTAKGDDIDDSSLPDTSKRMVDQTDYNKKPKVKKRNLTFVENPHHFRHGSIYTIKIMLFSIFFRHLLSRVIIGSIHGPMI